MCARIIIWVTRVSRGFSLPEPMPSDGRRRRSIAFFASAGPNPGLALAHRLVPHRQRHVALQPPIRHHRGRGLCGVGHVAVPSPRCWIEHRSEWPRFPFLHQFYRKIPAQRSQRWPRPVQARITPDCCVSSKGSAFRAIGPLPTRTATMIAK
jgi:hypothetical protein